MIILKKFIFFVQLLRFSLVYFFIDFKNPKLIQDIERWERIIGLKENRFYNLSTLMANYKEFRNIVIYRSSKNIIG